MSTTTSNRPVGVFESVNIVLMGLRAMFIPGATMSSSYSEDTVRKLQLKIKATPLLLSFLNYLLIPALRVLALALRALPAGLQGTIKRYVPILNVIAPHNGLQVGALFPLDAVLTRLDGRTFSWVELLAAMSEASSSADTVAQSPSSLIVINCGSYTCLPYRMRVRGVEEVVFDGEYTGMQERPQLLHLYIREAHPVDGWRVRANEPSSEHPEGVRFKQPTTMAERIEVAQAMQKDLGLRAPIFCDSIDNRLDSTLAACPDRLYVLSRDGRVVWKGGQGPMLYSLSHLEDFLRAHYDAHNAKNSVPPGQRK